MNIPKPEVASLLGWKDWWCITSRNEFESMVRALHTFTRKLMRRTLFETTILSINQMAHCKNKKKCDSKLIRPTFNIYFWIDARKEKGVNVFFKQRKNVVTLTTDRNWASAGAYVVASWSQRYNSNVYRVRYSRWPLTDWTRENQHSLIKLQHNCKWLHTYR